MAAFVIVDINIFDLAGFGEYRKAGVPLVEKYGGKYIAVSDSAEKLEEIGRQSESYDSISVSGSR